MCVQGQGPPGEPRCRRASGGCGRSGQCPVPGCIRAGGLSPVLSPLQRDCHNYIKMLLQLNSTHLYTCGTCAFSPACAYIVSTGSGVGGPAGGAAPPPPSGPCSGGPGCWGRCWQCCQLTARSRYRTCNTSAWSGTRWERCCWRMGRDAALLTPSTGPRPSWSVRHAAPGPSPSLQRPSCSARLNWGQAGTDSGGGAGLCRVACAGSQRERLFGRRRALRRDCQQLPGQRADHLPQPGEPHRPQDRELPQLAAG